MPPAARYRYTLTRTLTPLTPRSPLGVGRVLFVMLNPSTADATHDDATIRRCTAFARSWGFAELEVVNLFAMRATKPAELAEAIDAGVDAVGPINDLVISERAISTVETGGTIVLAWGAPRPFMARRAEQVSRELAANTRARLRVLGWTKHGGPRHPLYVRGETPLVDARPAIALSTAAS